MYEGRAVDIFYLDFSQALETVFHKLSTEKLFIYGLQEETGMWIENLLGPEGGDEQHKIWMENSE